MMIFSHIFASRFVKKAAWMMTKMPHDEIFLIKLPLSHNRAVDLNSSHLEIQYSIVQMDFQKIIDNDCFDRW